MRREQRYSETDYGKSLMPSTRREQFKDILKSDLGTLFKLALICLISFLPFLALVLIKDITIANIYAQAEASGTPVTSTSITSISNVYNAAMSVSLLVAFVGLAGVIQIIKNLVYCNGVLFWRDFGKGIKDNAGAYLKTGVLVALLLFGVNFAKDSFPFLFPGEYYKVFLGIMIGIVFGFIFPILIVQLVQDSIYKLSYIKGIINSSRLTFRSYLFLLLFSLVPLTLYLVKDIPNMLIVIYLAIDVVMLLISPIYILAIYEYCVSRFDKLINVRHYKSIYLKGLKNYTEESL